MPYLCFLGRNLKNLWSYLELTHSNLSKCKFSSKNRNSLYLGLNALPGYFLAVILKKFVIFEITVLKFVKFQCFIPNKKNFKISPKIAFLGKFRREFEKTIVIFEISTFEFVIIQSFMLNEKNLNLGTKLPCLGIFGQRFEKTIIVFKISTLEFVKMQSFM